ncbi:DUF6935 domain-containing protein [Leptospira neocaledonica]|uniref:DUF6935 domain-containing protein n=1 Tax=Leptospira neocaledonica TaxID=2023192 RepID=A0A2N0A0X6_9LEPT|nr:hypothetical protein [Leptospira neocaledonica]PJZ77956.1 hypothetical protein CH365_05885 [Leptospira neocaledonica]
MDRIPKYVSILLILLFAATLSAQNETYTVTANSWPADFSSFESFRDANAINPQGAVIVLLAALSIYSKNAEEGKKALIISLDANSLISDTSPNGYKGFNINRNTIDLVKRQLEQHPYLIGSYLPGSSFQNGYKPSNPPYNFTLTSNRFSGTEESGQKKLFLPSSGADTPRPVTVKRNAKGVWKASEFSSLLVGIKKPATSNPADDL